MYRPLLAVLFLTLAGATHAALLPVTPYTVVARVTAFENYRASGGTGRYSLATPYGSDDTIVAIILQPASLAGREIALPFESKKGGKELLVQPGTIFRFEYHANLQDLRAQTDMVYRRAIPFPLMGVIALKPSGEVAEVYEGVWSSRIIADLKGKAAVAR